MTDATAATSKEGVRRTQASVRFGWGTRAFLSTTHLLPPSWTARYMVPRVLWKAVQGKISWGRGVPQDACTPRSGLLAARGCFIFYFTVGEAPLRRSRWTTLTLVCFGSIGEEMRRRFRLVGGARILSCADYLVCVCVFVSFILAAYAPFGNTVLSNILDVQPMSPRRKVTHEIFILFFVLTCGCFKFAL